METAITPTSTAAITAAASQAREFIGQARAENTLRAYRSDWEDFSAWCAENGRQAMPASGETVALYIAASAATFRPATVQRRTASISQAHRAAGHDSPTKAEAVRQVWREIRRAKGTAQEQKTAITVAQLRALVAAQPDDLLGTRDRCLLLVGFAGAFRRSELVGLNREDVVIALEGATVRIRRSKTDQEGEGRKVGIPYGSRPNTCPVRALLAWLEASGITEGPLFRAVNRHGHLSPARLSDKAVALVVKRAAVDAGLDPDAFSGHSLRAGLATAAAAAGVSERAIMNQTGHKSAVMVRRYIREGSLYRENAAAGVGL